MLDSLSLQMFGQFPREVGNPSRQIARNLGALETFLLYNEGIQDCFTSVYPLDGTIDKIFFDFDGHARALADAKIMYKYLRKEEICVVPVASGVKGIHLYVLLQSLKYENAKSLLLNAAYSILKGSYGDEYAKTTADPHIFGNVRQLARMPNTRRPPDNNSWCVWLDKSFLDASWLDIINYCKLPHPKQRVPDGNTTLYDFPEVDYRRMSILELDTSEADTTYGSSATTFILKQLLPKECLFRGIIMPNPKHAIRVAATVELLQFYKPKELVELYATLNWVDFSYGATLRQIMTCAGLVEYRCNGALRGYCVHRDKPFECKYKKLLNGDWRAVLA